MLEFLAQSVNQILKEDLQLLITIKMLRQLYIKLNLSRKTYLHRMVGK